ncbi:ParB/RepB/Spo0J family partition protein [Actinophytocola sp.]|uniref:ParB/RepB/Spo0J family partition protein n=1 Tax=Actinophytocola sp. TaxID=1872138 RepID=UPI003899E8C5
MTPQEEADEVTEVDLDLLVLGGSPRSTGEDSAHTQLLAETDEPLPPILVHRSTMRVIDGAHRYRAARLRGWQTITVRFFDGTEEEAFIQAVMRNTAHGLPLSLSDRKAAALRILNSHPSWSNRRIGAATGLSDKTIRTIRRDSTAEDPQSNMRIGRDGRIRPVDRHAGRRRAQEVLARSPNATLREVASKTGISVSTARDVREQANRGEKCSVPHPRSETTGETKREPERRNEVAGTAVGDSISRKDLRAILERLKNDPSLKFSESGRNLLRLLYSGMVDAKDLRDLLDTLPPHCTGLVAQIARGCAEAWQGFATALEERSTTSS